MRLQGRCRVVSLALVTGIWFGLPIARAWAQGPVRAIGIDREQATAKAVVVEDSVPLVHTAQLLPVDESGQVVGQGHAGGQCEAVLDLLVTALGEAGSGLDRLAKVNVYVARANVVPIFRKALARRLRDKAPPATSFVECRLPRHEALIGIDAVAASSLDVPPAVATRRALPRLKAQHSGSAVAILPAGGKVYVSGQATAAGDLATATRRTLESLQETLRFLGLDLPQVVQLKAFLKPMDQIASVQREMMAFFGDEPTPPLVFVEWSGDQPIEIELIAATGTRGPAPPLEFLTPPSLKPSPVFSRVARIQRGPVIYLSSLHATPGISGADQVQQIFQGLGPLLAEVGSDFKNLAKATYYVTDQDASKALNDLRPRYYDPARPPAASKAMVAGTGFADRTVAVDLIAVPVLTSLRDQP